MERRLNRRKFVDPEDQKRLLLEEAIRNNKNVSSHISHFYFNCGSAILLGQNRIIGLSGVAASLSNFDRILHPTLDIIHKWLVRWYQQMGLALVLLAIALVLASNSAHLFISFALTSLSNIGISFHYKMWILLTCNSIFTLGYLRWRKHIPSMHWFRNG